jgi:hypothetical protein
MMLKNAVLIVASLIFLAGCKPNQTESQGQSAKDFSMSYPLLTALLANKAEAKNAFEMLVEAMSQPIPDQKRLLEVFVLRDSLASKLNPLVSDMYNAELAEVEKLENEAKTLGIRFVYAEGMPLGTATTTFLPKLVSELAEEPVALVISIQNTFNDGLGGEYPYADLTEHAKALHLAEELIAKYPKSIYVEQIFDIYSNLLRVFTDVHIPKDGTDQSAIIGGTDADPYPGMTNLSYFREYAKNHPQTPAGKLIAQVLENISQIELSETGKAADLFAVKVDEADPQNPYQFIASKYLTQGIDVPHTVWVDDKVWVVYRFYPDSAKAVAEMSKIKSKVAKAQILRIPKSNQTSEY